MNSRNQSQTQNYNQKKPQQASHTVFFNDQPRATLDRSKKYTFFDQSKNMTNKHHKSNQPHYSEDKNNIIKINHDSIQISKIIIGTLFNQTLFINRIFSNHINETNKHEKQDITHYHTKITFSHKTL